MAQPITWSPRVRSARDYIMNNFQDGLEEQESWWYGLYNSLLSVDLFQLPEYVVLPQYATSRGYIDFGVIYILHRNNQGHNRIAFFVEIKPSYAYESASARASADSQMRERFDRFRETGAIHVDRLYGISALGSQICIYTYTTATQEITPPLIQQHPTYFIDVAPKERWSTDVMSHLGEQMVRGIAAQTRQMCAGMQL